MYSALQNSTGFLKFFTRLWSVCKPLLFDTQNPEISGNFSAAHAYKYKTKQQAKMKRRQKEK